MLGGILLLVSVTAAALVIAEIVRVRTERARVRDYLRTAPPVLEELHIPRTTIGPRVVRPLTPAEILERLCPSAARPALPPASGSHAGLPPIEVTQAVARLLKALDDLETSTS